MEPVFQLSALIGIGPAFILLYFVWAQFEGLFNERAIFFNLVLGVVVGGFFGLLFLFISSSSRKYIDLSLIFVITFALFSELIKFLYLNRRHGEKTYLVTFNGLTFGLGIGAVWVMTLTYYYTKSIFGPIVLLYFVVMSFAFSLIHSSTGAIIGYGIYKNQRMRYLIDAILIMILFNFSLLPYIWDLPPYFSIASLIIAYPLFYLLVYKKILTATLPRNLRKKWRLTHYER